MKLWKAFVDVMIAIGITSLISIGGGIFLYLIAYYTEYTIMVIAVTVLFFMILKIVIMERSE